MFTSPQAPVEQLEPLGIPEHETRASLLRAVRVVAESLDVGIQLERSLLPGKQFSEQAVYVTTSTMYCELGRLSTQFNRGSRGGDSVRGGAMRLSSAAFLHVIAGVLRALSIRSSVSLNT